MDRILDLTILAGIFASAFMIIYLLYYMVTKKSIYDKLIASDLIAMPLISIIVLISMYYKTLSYISLILIISVVCFVGSVVTTRFLARKEFLPDVNSK